MTLTLSTTGIPGNTTALGEDWDSRLARAEKHVAQLASDVVLMKSCANHVEGNPIMQEVLVGYLKMVENELPKALLNKEPN